MWLGIGLACLYLAEQASSRKAIGTFKTRLTVILVTTKTKNRMHDPRDQAETTLFDKKMFFADLCAKMYLTSATIIVRNAPKLCGKKVDMKSPVQ